MAIVRQTKLFYFVNGTPYASLEEAQKADLKRLIDPALTESEPNGSLYADRLADWLLKNADAVATILRTTPRSRVRKPRKDKGVPRKKVEAVAP